MFDENVKTLWCGNLSDQVTEEELYELFLQAGPLEKVVIPRDKDGTKNNYAFITFCHDVSVPYAINLFRNTALYNRAMSLQCRAGTEITPLPAPIRAYSMDRSFDYLTQTNVKQQFIEMTRNIPEDDYRYIREPKQFEDRRDYDLVRASLQGNWSHRQHPYLDYQYEINDRRHDGDYRNHGSDYRNHGSDYRNHSSHNDRRSGHKHSRDWRSKNKHSKNHHRKHH